jgi:enoyl-CoA hydratase/carnithine racemase
LILNWQKKDNVAIIHIMDAAVDPASLPKLSLDLSDLCTEIPIDEEIRVIILTCVGEKSLSFEPSSFQRVSAPGSEPWKPWSLAEPIFNLDLPVIAAIHGDALDQILELALACDIRIATEASHFGFPQIKKALIPWDGGTQRLARLIGRGKALEMILTGEIVDALEAYRIGLVNRIVSERELTASVLDLAKEMAAKGPIALKYAKEAVTKGMDLTLEQGLRLEADLYYLIHTTRDREEGIRAFQQKSKAQFKGE